ncbi:peptidase S10 [Mucilaginibacter gynuensis]|uniref:Peptidase S10 n=1 Tax=Mucilaginibacter gynuensis TaxID=1302236 RepID=A0ABP8FVT1_9SPHI
MNKNFLVVIALNVITLLYSSWNKLSHQIALLVNKLAVTANLSAVSNLSVTKHSLVVNGSSLSYESKAGYMPVNGKDGKPAANIFYVAYSANNTAANKVPRPVTFVFNGGPGSSAIWLHLGAMGPIRVAFKNDKGDAPAPPYRYEDNDGSWLQFTDLVFIDPVSTGYSRPAKGVDAKQFYGYNEDIKSVGEFIRLYIEQNNRWGSPKFIAGESYGAARAVGLAGYLQNHYNMYLNGITLISPALNYQLINFQPGNESPYIHYLPSYAVAAQYHNRLSPELKKLTPDQLIKRTSAFSKRLYAYFLNEGDAASPQLTQQVIDSLHYYTGLSKEYIRKVNGRITDSRFTNQLLNSNDKTIGSFDSRFSGDNLSDNQAISYDPSETNLKGLFVSAFNTYADNSLHYKNDLSYEATSRPDSWNYAPVAVNRYLDVSEALKTAMTKNPNLKVSIACGYYDLSTPVSTTEYVVSHLGLNAALRKNISINYYKAGHMVYISKSANAKFKADGEKFYQSALPQIN